MRARRSATRPPTERVYGSTMRPPATKKAVSSSLSFLQQNRGLRLSGGSLETSLSMDIGDSAVAQKKLAFDELLRHMRGRTEDTEKLVVLRGKGEAEEGETLRQTCGFREEWRIERENTALKLLQGECREEGWENKDDALTAHLKCCAHVFVSGNPVLQTGPGQKTRRFQELLYAQQMDRILDNIDKKSPGVVIRDAIMDARTRFQTVLSTGTLSNNNTPREDTPMRPQVQCPTSPVDPAQSIPDVLHLYENVVSAKASVELKPSRQSPTTIVKLTPEFAQLLQRQRDEARWKSNENLAQSHHEKLCTRRILRAYRTYRTRWNDRQKMESIRQRTCERAARVLQLQLVPTWRRYRSEMDAKLRLLHHHQGVKIAVFCFWKWIYNVRCGFSTFTFDREPSGSLLRSVIRLQCHCRRKRAARWVGYMRLTKSIRDRKLAEKLWRRQQAAMHALADLDADLAEWRYRIGLERQRAQEELEKEGERFSTEWSKYEAKLRKDVMKAKLAPEWIPQMDQVSGEQYFLSTKTGRSVKEHPNLLLFKQLIAKQRIRAEELFHVQQSRLQDYILHLDSRLHERTQEILKEMVRSMHLSINN